ncbi:DAK2 domain-containing protein [Corynebacterium sp. USCH3]|uniref:DAK2 domain-containing protein n=1 Tax=Corynebacterium sp. USCH3 TaxID=3024840 RepID=UPI00309A17D1
MLTGAHVASWAEQAALGLARHKDEINDLNVFPIPDSDTGSNMTATMESAVERLHRDHGAAGSAAVNGTSVADVAASLAAGAVTGARGNSGLVLSQFLRALADSAAASHRDDLPVDALPGMLHRAEKLVRRAVSAPVEGTIITVLHAAADQASSSLDAAEGTVTAGDIVGAARDAAVEALAGTTGQLPELAAAGVVDAGGRGLVVILDALVDALGDGEPGQDDIAGNAAGDRDTEERAQAGTAEIEVMFTYRADDDRLDALRGHLNRRGNSVVIVPGEARGTWRVHVHTAEAGPLIELAYSTGGVSDLVLEVLPVVDTPEAPRPTAPVLALAPEGGLREMFAGAGATAGDTGTIIEEFERRGSGCIVLTNGQDTAELFGRLSSSNGEATVVDTESFVGGLAALAVYSPTADLDENAEEMADAVSAQRWRNTDGGVDALCDLVDDLLADGGELVTVLYDGEDRETGTDPDPVAEAVDVLRARHPSVELHSYRVPGLGTGAQVGVE